MKIKLLDKGFIRVIDKIGSDLTVVNAARVSFGKETKKYSSRDLKLVSFLNTHKHFSPFRHLQVQLHLKFPEFVGRQLYKHVVGIETTSNSSVKDHAWNEISGRYVPVQDFYYPLNYRAQSEDNKQASEGEIKYQNEADILWKESVNTSIENYEKMLKLGVAKEQARCILPLNQYTEVYWTASFQALANFVELRNEKTSQYEIQQYGIAIKRILFDFYPKTSNVWFGKE